MPLNLTCSFCGKQIDPGTGLMYVRNDNQRSYFCSRRCERNMLRLGRKARKMKWTLFYERGPSPPRSAGAQEAGSEAHGEVPGTKKEDSRGKMGGAGAGTESTGRAEEAAAEETTRKEDGKEEG